MTEHTDTVVLTDEYLDAARLIVEITAQEKDLAERKAAAKQIVEKALAVGERGISPDGEPLVAVRAGARVWNEAAARENLPEAILSTLLVTVTETRVDKDLAKDILAPALYVKCTKQNKPTVVLA